MTQDITRFVSDGFDRAKAGNAKEVYAAVAPLHDNGSLPQKSHYPFGWIIYYALHQAADSAIDLRKRMLARYLKLNVAKPHKLHSMILTEAIRLYKDAKNLAFGRKKEEVTTFSISRFALLWNTANLRPGDWRRKEIEGKPLSSTAEKLITHWTDEILSGKETVPAQLSEILTTAMNMYPDSPSLLYQQASLHIHAKNEGQALPLLKKAILLSPSKYYLWSRLALLIDPASDLKLHISLLHRAISTPGPEEFKGKVRLSLAQAWLHAGVAPQALWELLTVKRIYEANGWHLSPAFNKAMEAIPQGTVPADPAPAYKRIEEVADSYIFDALPELEVQKTYHKAPAPGERNKYGVPPIVWRVTDSSGMNYWLQPHRFKIQPHLPIGTMLRIRVSNGKPVKAVVAIPEETAE